ncbi:protein PIGBOS1 [Astyanax mexicanus]|uniref:Protein PIGBOS1 n=1 Tax=Astyanax mexicanus TaxID=7994 RepID=A0A8T2LV62_ASTMX|nr:protein PIGBOS1 [Astyanax mexicanus]
MLPRRIPFNQIAFATLLGVGGGIYIYKPMFEHPRRSRSTPSQQDIKTEADSKGTDPGVHENTAKPAASATNTGATPEASAAK